MDKEKIGKFICQCRKAKGLTQKQLAIKLNVTDRAVSKWERGKGCPDVAILKTLAECLDVSISELLEGQLLLESQIGKEKADEIVIKGIKAYRGTAPLKNKITIAISILAVLFIIMLYIHTFLPVNLNKFSISGNTIQAELNGEKYEKITIDRKETQNQVDALFMNLDARKIARENLTRDSSLDAIYIGKNIVLRPDFYYDRKSNKKYTTKFYDRFYFCMEQIVKGCYDDKNFKYKGKKSVFTNGKNLVLHDMPENTAEKAAVDSFLNQANIVEGETFVVKCNIFDIRTLSSDEYKEAEDSFSLLEDSIQKNRLFQYEIVRVVFDVKYSEFALTLGPQYPEGRCTQNILVGKTFDNQDCVFKVYDAGQRIY